MSPILISQLDVLSLMHKMLLGSFLDQTGKHDHQALHKLVKFCEACMLLSLHKHTKKSEIRVIF